MSLAREVQRSLESYYALETGPDVRAFVKTAPPGAREQVLVQQRRDTLEIAVVLPRSTRSTTPGTDCWQQVVEGVSHFVHLSERVRVGLPTTQLELELQAEVDKFVALALAPGLAHKGQLRAHHFRIYERVQFLHSQGTEAGDRYRLANRLAARLIARLTARGPHSSRSKLRHFYRLGLTGKIHMARAA